jgi:hypothetical protein
MDVFVIPLTGDHYELYCEHPSGEAEVGTDAGEGEGGGISGWGRRLVHRWRTRVSATIAACEQGRLHERAEPSGWLGRQRDRATAWAAERIVEQRLLWNLRTHEAATIAHPQDMTFDQANALVRRLLQRDYERHRRWTVIDGVLFVLTFVLLGPLFLLVPGVANLPALYFGFRTVLHFLSMRGARQGLDHVRWTGRLCPPLGELRGVAAMAPEARSARLGDIAARLRLEHLARFYDRVAV